MNKHIIEVEKIDNELKVKLNGSKKEIIIALGGIMKALSEENLGIDEAAIAIIANAAYSDYESEQRSD